MNKKEFRRLLIKHGIRNEEFIDDSWKNMGGFAKIMENKELEQVLKLFISRISKKKKEDLSRS